jgi:hypothetical protein
MKKNHPLVDFLRSQAFVLYVAIFSAIFLAPNTYFVFYHFSAFKPFWRELAALTVSLLIVCSILIYTVRKNHTVANYFAWFEISVSIYYYLVIVGARGWDLIPTLSFALMLPYALKGYSKEIDHFVDEDKNNQKQSFDNHELEEEIYTLKAQCEAKQQAIDIYATELSDARSITSQLGGELSAEKKRNLVLSEQIVSLNSQCVSMEQMLDDTETIHVDPELFSTMTIEGEIASLPVLDSTVDKKKEIYDPFKSQNYEYHARYKGEQVQEKKGE